MPRKKGNKQTNQSNATSTAPFIFAKCTGCQVNGQLIACEFCEYPECATCIEKHRQEDTLSQMKAMIRTRIDSLRQQTGKYNYSSTALEDQNHFTIFAFVR
jgi:hypothetical protein